MKILLVVFITAFLSLAAYVRYLESITVFHPAKEIERTPRSIGLGFEDIYFKTKDKYVINGWLIKHPQAHSTVIYFHGNAGNMADRLEKIILLRNLKVNVFIIDYRGYGKSQGKPCEHGVYEDAVAAFDYLLTRGDIEHEKIWVYGTSLGGTVAIDLATKKRLACLIIDSTFSSAADMGRTIYPFIPSFLIQTKMDSLAKIKKITIPKLFLHSREDDVVPFRLGQKLFAVAPAPKEFLEIKGGHNDNYVYSREIWLEGVSRFLKHLNLI